MRWKCWRRIWRPHSGMGRLGGLRGGLSLSLILFLAFVPYALLGRGMTSRAESPNDH